jgi:von Willebrand factor type A domain/Aerotolerance regulator N-terminal
MTFDSPSSLYWFGLAVPIIIFYILKIRLRRKPVSTVIFWKQVLDEKNPRSIWQRLRHFVSLLLQLAMLSLLVLALADPYFFWEIRSARRIVLVVDTSASMNATDVKPTRLAEAKVRAGQLITSMRPRDEIALVTASTQPQVVVGFTSRQRTLNAALKAVTSTDGPSYVSEAIALGQRLLGERNDGKQSEVYVLTDGCFSGIERFLTKKESHMGKSDEAQMDSSSVIKTEQSTDATVSIHVIGERSSNIGITQFQVRRSLVDPLGYEILAEVTNLSDLPVDCRFEVDFKSASRTAVEPIDVVPLKLEANGKWSHVFEKTSAEGGHLLAHLNFQSTTNNTGQTPMSLATDRSHQDTLEADNSAWAVLPRREIQPVILVTSGNLFLQKVFEVNPLVKLTVVEQPPETIPAGTVVVYHRTSPAALPKGSVFVIDPANSSDIYTVGEPLESAIVTKQDKDSPLMSHVRLDNVVMPEARKLAPNQPELTQVLAAAVSTDPLFFAVNRSEGKVLVMTVNLDKGDLPLRTAFPIFVGNALHWFAGNKSDLRESLATGSVTTVTSSDFVSPMRGNQIILSDPTGLKRSLPMIVDKTTFGPLDQCGIWKIEDEQPTSITSSTANESRLISGSLMEIACNLSNSTESDIRPPNELLSEKTTPSPLLSGIGSRPIWFWLSLLALALTSIEWWLYQRRVIS